ncbi:AI-2E family transporter [Massilia agilis]|uniref:AI-2E family transporter n=1 Tax=Massilia agilis TaxID=1811226 RepID=A0ABT2DFR0_9BURK|nr:AI-2E family transporter [Massilia agilis]MCS0810097.1 AI-2E family transporter [Massilia agilis]
MSETQRSVLSAVFSLAIIGFAIFVTQRFVLPLLWAAILAIATWPLYKRALRSLGGREIGAALVVTVMCAVVFITPLALGIMQAAKQAPALAALVASANNEGLAAPDWLVRIPLIGNAVLDWWQTTLSQPHGLTHLLTDGSVTRMHTASEVLRTFGSGVMHRMIDVLFAFLCLFFFYKDGAALLSQLDAIGNHLIGNQRWALYSNRVPIAIRATVNGLVLVGLAEGILLGIAYEFAGVPSAVLWTAATGVLAIIPFGAPLAFGSVAALLFYNGNTVGAAAIIAWGAVVLFVADHFVRPTMIGNATKLPFLAVLLGILGGVETLGLIGLFVGPVVMTLFVTLWHEEKMFRHPAR